MLYVEIVLFVLSVMLLAVGYRRNRRNLLLAGAIVLFLSSAGAQFATGFAEGIHDGITSWARN